MGVPLTLKVFKGDQLVTQKDYDRDIIKIGRLSSMHLCLDDEKVARVHSVIDVAADGTLSIIDMGSVEGTLVNGKRVVNKGPLSFGDEIQLGSTTIRVERAAGAVVSSSSGIFSSESGVMSSESGVVPLGGDSPPTAPAMPFAMPPQFANPSVQQLMPVQQPSMQQLMAVQQQQQMLMMQQQQQQLMAMQQQQQMMAAQASRGQAYGAAPDVTQQAIPMPQAGLYQQPPRHVPQPPVAAAVPISGSARGRPRRRKGSGPLGLEVRLMWGDHIVGEHFLPPDAEKAVTVGSGPKVDFAMGEGKFGAAAFVVARNGKGGGVLRFTDKMKGELHRKGGDQVMSLSEARQAGVASSDGDANALTLGSDDFAWVDLGGGISVEAFFQPVPKAVFVPFSESVDFTALNIFLLVFFLGALFLISAANRNAEGDEYADELSDTNARIAKLLIKPPEKNPILQRFEKKKDSGEAAQKHKGDEGQMGKKEAPKRSAHTAPKGDTNNKDQARLLVKSIFSGSSGGLSIITDHQALGGELKGAIGNMFGAAPGDAAGLGGLGLRGSGSGGGGVGDTIGIGGIGTKGRGGGTGGYGSGVGVLGGKQSTDIGITSGDPTVIGSLDKELIRKVIHANRGQIRYCYESQLTRFPKLAGKVAVKFVISAQGSVATSSVAQATTNNAELEACVAGRVRTWIFPKPKGGGVVVVTYPFIFKESGQ
jgi:TonB family protein